MTKNSRAASRLGSGQIRIVAISVLAGLIAGAILLVLNFVILQPLIDLAVDYEIDELLADGEFDEEEFDRYLQSQQSLRFAMPIIIGAATGALFGLVYLGSRNLMKNYRMLKSSMLITGITWLVLYVIPTLKYPAEMPRVVEPVILQEQFLAGYMAVSGLSALAIAFTFSKVKRENKWFGAAALYLAVIAIAYFIFPTFQSEQTVPDILLYSFRTVSALIVTAFWFVLGFLNGKLWERLYSDKA